jgi:hypothetical protein
MRPLIALAAALVALAIAAVAPVASAAPPTQAGRGGAVATVDRLASDAAIAVL